MGIRAITTNYVNAHFPKAKRKNEGWCRPPRGFVKLNVDASFDHDQLRGITGAFMRDDKGNFIVDGNWRIQYCADALTAEAVALRFGLLLAQKTGCNRLIINSDNTEVIATMNNGGQSAGAAAAIFEDCFLWPVIFLKPVLNIVTGKRIK